MGLQLRLTLDHPAVYERARFVVAPSNAEAVAALDVWPSAEGGVLALIGPEGSGKTHLAMAWAKRVGAGVLDADTFKAGALDAGVLEAGALDGDAAPPGALLFEDADRQEHGEAFFHLLNRAAAPRACLLLTGRRPPRDWRVAVADLRSRLNALAVIEAGPVDDAILRGILIGLFQQRNIRPPSDLLDYLLRRIERSAAAARAIVSALDEASQADHRPVSRVLARHLLKDEAEEAHEGV